MMTIDRTIQKIIDNCFAGKAPTKKECAKLLSCSEISVEASFIRAAADAISRNRFGNEAIILGQIGIEIDKCSGKCKFCGFGDGHTNFLPSVLTKDDVLLYSRDFMHSGEVFALFLMTMHDFNFDYLLSVITAVRATLTTPRQIVVNIGDFDVVQARELQSVGVNGAYHVCRLREGTDTALNPADRKKTIETIKNTGLDWYYCCEPVGPEHSAQEIADQLFLGVEIGCFQHAAMRRVCLAGKPLAHYGQISELRLGLITAVVALASLGNSEIKNIAVHEPNLIGLTSGANVIYAEKGANPRDQHEKTQNGRGYGIAACKKMLYESGFSQLLTTKNSRIPLDYVSAATVD